MEKSFKPGWLMKPQKDLTPSEQLEILKLKYDGPIPNDEFDRALWRVIERLPD